MTQTLRTLAPAPRVMRAGRLALLGAGITSAALLGGCSSHAPRPEKMAQQAREALSHGQSARAVMLAEQAVAVDGRNPALRLLLANAYLRSGRFESARQGFADAIELGDDSSRAAIGLVLSDLALGHNSAALDTMNTYGDILPAADLGLALAMAGQNQRGIEVLTNAIRQGNFQPKVRQNLAFAYALSGMWAEAKTMAGQDVPADQVDARIQGWAAMARPEDGRRRVASLLGTPLIGDTGQPEALALAHFPATTPDQPAPVKAAAAAPVSELPAAAPAPLASGALARIDLAPANVAAAPAPTPAAVALRPTVAPSVPVRVAARPRAAVVAPTRGLGTHLVQLGAFNSEESARRAWHHFVTRDPHLAGHPNLITKVTVRGRDFWRVQAAGFAGQASAAAQCGQLRAHGGACLVMAVNAAAHVNGVQTADARPAKPASHPAPQPAPTPVQPVAAHPGPNRPRGNKA